MPNEVINLTNLRRFKENLDGELQTKADADAVYSKAEENDLLAAKQDVLTQAQLNDINNVPNLQDELTDEQMGNANATPIPNSAIDFLLEQTIDPILANNSWETIKTVCEIGIANNYWSVGDTKTDVGTDSATRTFRIADMSGLYGKHVVFEQVELESTDYQWQATLIDDYYNNYSVSNIRTVVLPSILLKYSSSLQGVLTNTTYKVATNGKTSTLLELSDKLFLPAEKEVRTSRSLSRTEEFSALTTFAYYIIHTSYADHIKYKPSQVSGYNWWLRSPESGSFNYVCYTYNNGEPTAGTTNMSYGVAPVFAL